MSEQELCTPTSLDEALALLSGAEAQPLAGATWLMRGPLRGEAPPARYVVLGGLTDLNDITITDEAVTLGAGVTHARLAAGLAELPQLRGLAQAAGRSANPAIRQVATLGGNLCAADFPAADLPPALLALQASVRLQRDGSSAAEELPLEDFLAQRADLLPGALVTAVTLPRRIQASAHARLTLKAAGDYPVAIVSVAKSADRLRIAVGSVGPVALRWPALEEALETSVQDGAPNGADIDADRAAALAAELSGDLPARDGVEAPARYRRRVLPALVRRAFAQLSDKDSQGRAQP
ncbi:FAD binding domain-containing protein [Fodinicurvata sediminis]|uniref:FAD binding domain-containing protein n=1 Tax=Fodinicurvata sediminis TaxID=1121832 RepID=UPI0003FECD2B|nr:FAD binding domain-containing protein [Fodinicurvata sediminis]